MYFVDIFKATVFDNDGTPSTTESTYPLVSIPWNIPLALSAILNAAKVAVSAVLLALLTFSLSSFALTINLSILSSLSTNCVLKLLKKYFSLGEILSFTSSINL